MPTTVYLSSIVFFKANQTLSIYRKSAVQQVLTMNITDSQHHIWDDIIILRVQEKGASTTCTMFTGAQLLIQQQ